MEVINQESCLIFPPLGLISDKQNQQKCLNQQKTMPIGKLYLS